MLATTASPDTHQYAEPGDTIHLWDPHAPGHIIPVTVESVTDADNPMGQVWVLVVSDGSSRYTVYRRERPVKAHAEDGAR